MKKNVILTSLVMAAALFFMACSNPSGPAGSSWKDYDPVLFTDSDVPETISNVEFNLSLSPGTWRFCEIENYTSWRKEIYMNYTVTDSDITCTSRIDISKLYLTESEIEAVKKLSKERLFEIYSNYKSTDYYIDGNTLVLVGEYSADELSDYNKTSTTFTYTVLFTISTNTERTKYKTHLSTFDDTEYFLKIN